ncbi:MAG: nucleotidyltransferase domain-containing protein [Thermotogota bacterium]|nr:nucleotidyltransferase domain-containing protein [Thermotogota bacterium]
MDRSKDWIDEAEGDLEHSSSVQIFYPGSDREEVIELIEKRLDGLKEALPLSLVVLFGSYAKDNYTTSSDIDLFVVYRGQEIKDAYSRVKKAIDVYGIEPHVYTESEYREMKEVAEKMIMGGVVLFSRWKNN